MSPTTLITVAQVLQQTNTTSNELLDQINAGTIRAYNINGTIQIASEDLELT